MNPTLSLLPTLPQPVEDGRSYVFSTLIEMVSGPDGWVLQPTALGREVLDLIGEAAAADVHRELNRRVADALGLGGVHTDPTTGEKYLPSWHDMPERVAALVKERDEARRFLAETTDETLRVVGEITTDAQRQIEKVTAERDELRALTARLRAQLGEHDDYDPRKQAILIHAGPQTVTAFVRAGFVPGSGSLKQWLCDQLAELAALRAGVMR